MPEACGVSDDVGHECPLLSHPAYPPASSGPWLPGVMACQGRNRRLVRDCPTSIDAQMTRKVQRVGGEVTEVGASRVKCLSMAGAVPSAFN